MRSRKRTVDSSLELLLDTICNTFGGVLFVAILVTVLLRTTSHIDSPASPERQESALELQSLVQQQIETLTELETLQRAANEQRRLADQFVDEDIAALINKRNELLTAVDAASTERLERLGSIADLHIDIQRVKEELQHLDASLEEARRRRSAAEATLKSEIASRTEAAGLPRQRQSFKEEVGLVVRYGRLYVPHRYDSFGDRGGLNTDDMVIVDEGKEQIESTPKPYAGVPISEDQTETRARLKAFNSRTQYLAICVWPDSFEQFQQLKNSVIEMGFEYRLMPMADGDSFFDRGGTNSQVQ